MSGRLLGAPRPPWERRRSVGALRRARLVGVERVRDVLGAQRPGDAIRLAEPAPEIHHPASFAAEREIRRDGGALSGRANRTAADRAGHDDEQSGFSQDFLSPLQVGWSALAAAL